MATPCPKEVYDAGNCQQNGTRRVRRCDDSTYCRRFPAHLYVWEEQRSCLGGRETGTYVLRKAELMKERQAESASSRPSEHPAELRTDESYCMTESPCGTCSSTCRTLRAAGLRPTRQRIALAEILFSRGDRHLTAEALYEEARQANFHVSLATVYNTLHQLTGAGLLKAVAVDSARTYFDTNTGNHHHFYNEETCEVIDMPEGGLSVENLPPPPEGMEIASVDIVVRLRRAR